MGWQCHPLIVALQIQGAIIFLLMCLGWTWSAWQRRKALKEWPRLLLQNQQRKQQILETENAQNFSPPLTVIMPIKSCREGSLENWRSHLNIEYSGQTEFIFVAGNERDSAYGPVRDLLQNENVQNAKLIVAEPCMNCSQKVWNLATGIRNASENSKYVLFLDDDIRLASGFVQALVDRKEEDGENSFMSTAYPFDLPDKHANILTYAVLVFHLPLIIGISFQEHSFFVWGGCMLLPLADLTGHGSTNNTANNLVKLNGESDSDKIKLTSSNNGDKYGILDAWESGGYSDDLIVAGKCSQHKLPVLCPSFAVLPQRLGSSVTWRQFWNYLRRQLYVLDTYADDHNRTVNYTMMTAMFYLSWAFAIPIIITAYQIFSCLVGIIVYLICTKSPNLIAFLYDCSNEQYPKECQSGICGLQCDNCFLAKTSVLLILIMSIFAHLGLMSFVQVILAVFKKQDGLGCRDLQIANFNWIKLWAGFLLTYLIIPFCMIYTLCYSDIEWSGIKYRRKRGKVHRVASRHF
eukprot:TRINITY_DN11773_c0_g4_i1.p1 TRINITY_DN11773_c0_g4~~TRINITY_DN11773_c0_g4_i1.p1  ORF type:complete len:520 (-),score=50.65 TRINITY_DN11773_c0_g4_i1:86-1645(-)